MVINGIDEEQEVEQGVANSQEDNQTQEEGEHLTDFDPDSEDELDSDFD